MTTRIEMTSSAFVTSISITARPLPLHLSNFRQSQPICPPPNQPALPSRRRRLLMTSTSPSAESSPEPSSTAPTSKRTCFGQGKRLPRRVVGLYELERLDIDPFRIFSDGSSRNDAAFGAIVAVFVLALLGAPLLAPGASVEAPVALLAGGLLVAWAVDSLALDSAFAGAAASLLQPPQRVATHEAAHLLVSYLSGVPVTGYSLPRIGNVMEGGGAGVQVDISKAEDVYSVAAVGMAGVAAECLEYGSAEGGAADFVEVCKAVQEGDARFQTAEAAKRVARWGLLQAAIMLTEQKDAHAALVKAMREGRSLEDCVQVVEGAFNWTKVEVEELSS